MTDERVRTMDAGEIDEFLGRGGTGVLSLAKDDDPYSIPVSYGYDPGSRAFYLRLGYTPESEKHEFVRASAPARLVVYDRSGGTWKSVIATGTLDAVPESELDLEIVHRLREADLPLVDIWDEPMADITFEITRLACDTITGRSATGELPL